MNDGVTCEFKTTEAFDKGLAGLIYGAGLNAKTVVEKESGEVIKTLVRLSMPENVAKTRKSISDGINSKFNLVGDEKNSKMERHGKVGPSGIDWYQVDGDFLRGVAPQADKRDATAEQIAPLRWAITKRGRLNLPFKNRKTDQRVLLYQTILTKKSTVAKVVRMAQGAIGRRSAGWIIAVTSGAIKITGSLPRTVTRHAQGARGAFVNGLNVPKFPKFTIINTAKGITAKDMNGKVATALAIRAKAMQRNALLFMSGKKKVSDYAR